MSNIETIYRGHVIRYNDNSEEWYCSDLEGKGYSNAKLSRIRAAIDKIYLDRRKSASIKCLEIAYGGPRRFGTIYDAVITEYIGPVMTTDYKTGGKKLDHHKIAVSAKRDGDKMTRKEMKLSDVAKDSSEIRDAYEAYAKAYEQAEELHRKAYEMWQAIPRLMIEEIAELVAIKKGETEEGAA